jgi:hypothetical protein
MPRKLTRERRNVKDEVEKETGAKRNRIRAATNTDGDCRTETAV